MCLYGANRPLAVLMQVPSNLLVSKISYPMLYINGCVFVWGAISACTALVQSFGGLIACRFMLGFVRRKTSTSNPPGRVWLMIFSRSKRPSFREHCSIFRCSMIASDLRSEQLSCTLDRNGVSPSTPDSLHIPKPRSDGHTMQWYIELTWSAGSAFGNLLAIGILRLDGVHGISGWRWLFIIEGVLTCAIAIAFACLLPNTIKKIWNLNQQQADFVRWNFEKDQKQSDQSDEISAFKGLVMAVTDPKTWMLCATLYATYTAAAVNNFFPTVVGGLGFSRNASYGMTAPPFILSALLMLVNGFHSDKVSS